MTDINNKNQTIFTEMVPKKNKIEVTCFEVIQKMKNIVVGEYISGKSEKLQLTFWKNTDLLPQRVNTLKM